MEIKQLIPYSQINKIKRILVDSHKHIHHQISKSPNLQVITLLHCFIITSCAVVSSPTGGEKDKTPPNVIAENPKNLSTNFSSKDINISFDEWITLQNPQNVLITPDIEPKPKMIAKRNELSIYFKQTLDTNTTYSIFFGNELKDNNEGNPLDNYAYVFSTGSYIDSIEIEGKLQTFEDKLPNNVLVLLYKNWNDTAFTSQRPNYITKANPDGSFSLKHLKQGIYKIYALEDKNNNYYYDLPTEQIGFLDTTLQIDSNTTNIIIPVFLPEEEKYRITEKDKAIQNGKITTTWNKSLSKKTDQFQIKTQNNINAIAFPEGKKLQIYFTNLQQDTGTQLFFIIHNDKIIDSIETKIEREKETLLFFDTTTIKNLKIVENNDLKIVSNFLAIADIDTNKIIITDTSGKKIPYTIKRNDDLKTYTIQANWRANQKNNILFQDSCLQDLAGNFNKKQEVALAVEENKKGGNLLLNVELDTNYTNLVFILKNNQGKIVESQSLRNAKVFKINIGLMPAGTYQAEIIKDDNDNEIWNSGNFYKKTLPEKIYKHPTPIILKENWDAEETIKPNFNQTIKTQITETIAPKKYIDLNNTKLLEQKPNQNNKKKTAPK